MTKEEAIKTLINSIPRRCSGQLKKAVEMAIEALREEPRKTAKWIEYGIFRFECSNCNCKAMRTYNYCSYCGAKMEGEK